MSKEKENEKCQQSRKRGRYSRVHLSTVLNGHAAISADLALRLELAGISTGRQWLAMKAAYDLWQAEHRGQPNIVRLHEVPA
ncbi:MULTISPECIES: HigA family addiction module antitoxin [unclassified Pseudomonas]|uniref:HigA family addiction module antitoxin n=1 Tax=unclassified Pseudomonas TaxID=196821 RepID=UPI001CBF72FE|nr:MULTISPECIES: HigA family addiction module antitoxin [unclassified Pseudomonas]